MVRRRVIIIFKLNAGIKTLFILAPAPPVVKGFDRFVISGWSDGLVDGGEDDVNRDVVAFAIGS